MAYSHKQKLFAEFMLKKIGISNPDDIETYLQHLEKLYGRMVNFASHQDYRSNWKYSVSECVDALKKEIDLKKTFDNIALTEAKHTLSATEIASFEFCPASFAISKSFVIEYPSGEEFTETGKLLHERLLAARTNWHKVDGVNFSSNDLDVSIIRSCELVFAGHQDPKRKFVNGNWTGVPDYIFRDVQGNYFVVEEKFHYKRDPVKKDGYMGYDDQIGEVYDDAIAEEGKKEQEMWSKYRGHFFSNHIVQIASYILNITDYTIKYGYLLYWYYDNTDNEPYIHKVVAKKIIPDDQTKALYSNAVEGINELKSSGNATFLIDKLNMRKCAGCVVNKYCGHKTGRYKILSFPYKRNYLSLFFAPFPNELRKPPV